MLLLRDVALAHNNLAPLRRMLAPLRSFMAPASSDGQPAFLRDFVAAWNKVMKLDRFDIE